MLNIYLVRHGQDEDNFNSILNGHRDTPLTELGLAQAKTLADNLNIKFDKIFSSPLKRARMTADILGAKQGLRVINEDLLIERDFGELSGRPITEAQSLSDAEYIQTPVGPYIAYYDGLENWPEVIKRAKELLAKINDLNLSGNIAFVTSGDIGTMIYASYYNMGWEEALKNFHFGNTEVVKLSPDTNPKEAVVFSCKQYNA